MDRFAPPRALHGGQVGAGGIARVLAVGRWQGAGGTLAERHLPVASVPRQALRGGLAASAWLRLRLRMLAGWQADGAALLLGAVSAFALPPFGLVPLLLLSVPGLLALVDTARGPRSAFRRGYAFGFGHHLVGLYWITEAILVKADQFWWLVPFAVPITAAGLALFIALPCSLCRAAPRGWRRALLFSGLWVLFDIARQFVLTGFPWNPLGSVWALSGPLGDAMIQPASLVGVHGLTLATVLLAATPALDRRAMLAGLAVLLSWLGFGVVRLSKPAPQAPQVLVVVAQGNVSEGEKHDRSWSVATFRRYLELTRSGVAKAQARMGADPLAGGSRIVVVWPETASPFLLQEDAAARQAIAQASAPALASLVGTVRFDADGRPRNSLMAVLPDGAAGAVYDKSHLVPFGEYVPSWFPLMQLVPGGGFASGPGIVTQHVVGLPPYGALICYETIFPSQVVDARDRPDWLLEVTNDAWFGLGAGPRQHLAAGRLRAVEEGLPLVRAANTGISAAFDALGREHGRLGLQQAGTLVVALPGRLPPTGYARLGLLTPVLLALAACALGMGMGRRTGAESFRL